MGKWTSTRVMQVVIAIFGLSTFAMAGLRVWARYAKQSELGEACLDGCRPGLSCYRFGMLGYCTKPCAREEDCPAPYLCRPAGEVSICKRPPDQEYGERCDGAEECTTGMCNQFTLVVRGRTCRFARCVQPCGPARECPEGSECTGRDDGGPATCLPVAAARRQVEDAYARDPDRQVPPLECL